MKKIYKRKEEGIASTVGTIFALMIFTALLGMFMTQVVPVTMKDNEARHDTEVLSQLSQLRSEVDILTLTRDTNYTAYAPIKLGAEGVPLFASPTYGQLSLYPSKLSQNYVMNVSFTDRYGNEISKKASGSLQFISPNKYYVPELFEYANGALLRYNFNSNSSIFSINPNIRFQGVSLGKALDLGDNKGYVQIQDTPSLFVGNHITIEAWIYKTSASQGAIFSDLQGTHCEYSFEIGNGVAYFYSNDGGTEKHISTNKLKVELNKWVFVALTWDGSNVRFYKNGKMVDEVPFSASPVDTPNKPYRVGRRLGGAAPFKGMIDELRVLNRPLSDEEIGEDYYSGFYYPTGDSEGTILWYHFDNTTGNEVYDSGPYHLDGTLNSGATLKDRTGVNIAATLENIFGKPDSVTGTETRDIAISLYGISDESYNLGGGTLNISFNDFYSYSSSFSLNFTKYWIAYVNSTLTGIGLKYNVDYIISGDTITIYGANTVSLKMVYLNFEIER